MSRLVGTLVTWILRQLVMVGYVVVLRIAQCGRSDESCVLDGCKASKASKETVSLMVSSARDSFRGLMRQKLRVLYSI